MPLRLSAATLDTPVAPANTAAWQVVRGRSFALSRTFPVPEEEGDQFPCDPLWGILRDEVSGPRDQVQFGTWDLLFEYPGLRGIEPTVPLSLFQVPEPQQVADVHGEPVRQCRDDPAPQVRTVGRTVHQDHRWPLAEHLVGHFAC